MEESEGGKDEKRGEREDFKCSHEATVENS